MGVAIVFATILSCIPAFAQTGGLTGKCTGKGNVPLAGYQVQIERTDTKWTSHVKTNKKGEYTYIGLPIGMYKVTLLGQDGKPMYFIGTQVGLGDPTEINFDMAQLMEQAQKMSQADAQAQAATPEGKAQAAKQAEEQKQNTNLKQLFDQGRQQYAQKQYADAAASFEKALPMAKDKNINIVLSQIGDSYYHAAGMENNPDTKKQDLEKALDAYQKVLTADPNDAAVHNNVGSIYADENKTEDAAAEFKKAADIDPAHASSYYYNMGAILVNRGQMDQAAEALKKATDIDPNNANAWYWYGMALMGKAQIKPDGTMVPAPGTLEAFQTYLKLQPSGPWASQAQASIDSLQSKASVEYKKAPQPKR